MLFAENTSRFQHLDFCMWERSWQKLHGKTAKANQDTNNFRSQKEKEWNRHREKVGAPGT